MRLFYEKGRHHRFDVLSGGAALEKALAPEAAGTVFLSEGPFVRMPDV